MNYIKHSFYTIFHPFNGFYELKNEKKGNLLISNIFLGVLILTFIISRQLTGFIFNNNNTNELNLLTEILSVLVPLLLWCVSNWCVTTLTDGEGNFSDIYTMTCYSLLPIIIINVPLVLVSNVLTVDESEFYVLFYVLSMVWTGFLLFTGLMTIHQFTVKKTLFTAVIAILGALIMIFLILLLFALLQQLINFFILVYREISLRFY